MPGMRTLFAFSVLRRAMRFTCTTTMPPARRVACAIASISPSTASSSIVTLPSSSAVVPRRNAMSTGTGLKNSHSSPASVTTSTKSGGVRALCRAPGRHVAHQLRQDTLRQRVRLDPVFRGEANEPRRIDQCARDRALQQAFVREMRGTERGPVADADDADGRYPFRLALGEKAPLD